MFLYDCVKVRVSYRDERLELKNMLMCQLRKRKKSTFHFSKRMNKCEKLTNETQVKYYVKHNKSGEVVWWTENESKSGKMFKYPRNINLSKKEQINKSVKSLKWYISSQLMQFPQMLSPGSSRKTMKIHVLICLLFSKRFEIRLNYHESCSKSKANERLEIF